LPVFAAFPGAAHHRRLFQPKARAASAAPAARAASRRRAE